MDFDFIYLTSKSFNQHGEDPFHGKSIARKELQKSKYSEWVNPIKVHIIRDIYKSGKLVIYDVTNFDLESGRLDEKRKEHQIAELLENLEARYTPIKRVVGQVRYVRFDINTSSQIACEYDNSARLVQINGKMYDTSLVYQQNGAHFSKVKKHDNNAGLPRSTSLLRPYVKFSDNVYKCNFSEKVVITHISVANCYTASLYPDYDICDYRYHGKKQIKVLNEVLNTYPSFSYRNSNGVMVNGPVIKKPVGIYLNVVELSTQIITDYIEFTIKSDTKSYMDNATKFNTYNENYNNSSVSFSFFGNEIEESYDNNYIKPKACSSQSSVTYEFSQRDIYSGKYEQRWNSLYKEPTRGKSKKSLLWTKGKTKTKKLFSNTIREDLEEYYYW